MRDSLNQKQHDSIPNSEAERAASQGAPYDARRWFASFYRSTVEGEPTDRMTISNITEYESRFHYNAVENSIIRAFAKRFPPPPIQTAHLWRMLQERRGLRLLDVGSGTGHWIDFMRQVFHVAEAVGIEIVDQMCKFLYEKYASEERVTVLQANVAEPNFTVDRIGGPVDFITAIGVMFHIVDDERWRAAMHNLAATLKPGGLMFVGGDFGAETRNLQLVATDQFDSWKEFEAADREVAQLVTKRVRSLETWQEVAYECGLRIVDLVRTERNALLSTPENDVLVLSRPPVS